jgi:hypothetical protein
MLDLKEVATVLFLNQARQAGMLRVGRLTRAAAAAQQQQSWCLHGAMQHRMFELARNARQGEWQYSTHVMRSQGIAHVVLCQRLQHWEHRFVLQLVGKTMRALMKDERGPRLMFRSSLEVQCHALAMPHGDWSAALGAVHVQEVLPENTDAALCALREVAARTLCVSGSDGLPRVRDACVTVVPSPEFELDLQP